jgi:recombinational DNA repair ATPase RecF
MDDLLLTGVMTRLDAIPLDGPAEALLCAALEDQDTLDRALDGAPTARPRDPVGTANNASAAPAGAYLQSVTVTGFRGIGPSATLPLTAGPGLTVVCGRNGSGKSSFAEALEVLLTGDTQRWAGRSAVWKDTWRCIHSPQAEITAELLIEGTSGPTLLRRTWAAADTKIEDAGTTVQRPGQPRTDIGTLGWAEALVTQRPFLSHAELESLLAQPSNLYHQLNSLLGLEDMDAALARLTSARLAADRESKLAGKDLAGVRETVTGVDDERAARAAELLQSKAPDVAALAVLAAAANVADEGPLVVLGQLSTLTVPDADVVAAAAAGLREAADRLEAVQTSAVGGAASTAQLLSAALAHTAGHDGGACPVCGTAGVIDGAWRARTEAEIRRLHTSSQEVTEARAQVDIALRTSRALVAPVPAVLAGAELEGVDTAGALAAWRIWADPHTDEGITGCLRLADHLLSTHPPLTQAVDALMVVAREERSRRQDRWAPLAQRLAGWCQLAERSARAKTTTQQLRSAEDWMKLAAADLRHERLRPFADRTVGLWRELRQSSNVDLVEVRLAGAGNRSHVDFAVTVDGNEATGLGVMSQGEVNALALSVFLPRATMPGSPFRFLIIDDPVQAMDPSKVDGLARVLVETANDRQVIVFTHDDRLPDSIRRLELPARIVQVTRRPGSIVELQPGGDPCEMLLQHAFAVVRDPNVPTVVSAQVVPGLCRTAIEQACIDTARKRRLRRGDSHEAVEAVIDEADKTMSRLALGLIDDPSAGGEVYGWLNTHIGSWAGSTIRTLQTGTHQGGQGVDMGDLLRDTRKVVTAIQSRA